MPGLAGSFPYFGTRVFFPKNAYIFTIVCEEGIYEKELLRHIQTVVKAGSWYFDVGANIGLMSVQFFSLARTCTYSILSRHRIRGLIC